ncbi:unnamed protein product [Coccothraustes coccothraustes]
MFVRSRQSVSRADSASGAAFPEGQRGSPRGASPPHARTPESAREQRGEEEEGEGARPDPAAASPSAALRAAELQAAAALLQTPHPPAGSVLLLLPGLGVKRNEIKLSS